MHPTLCERWPYRLECERLETEVQRLQAENDRIDEELFRKQMAIVRLQAENEEELFRQQKQMAALRAGKPTADIGKDE
jgi:hypothetical protein